MTKVLIAGGRGLIGMRLSGLLKAQGYEVAHLSRQARAGGPYPTYAWNPAAGTVDAEAVRGADYIINLAGEGIADRPWTEARKAALIGSRTDSARTLLRACMETGWKPKAYLAASAIGYYGDRGEERLPETAGVGQGFMADTCAAWEAATEEVRAALGVRAFVLRIGIVLSSQGGALAKMIPPAKLLVSPYFGDGRQWYAWIHIDDVCGIFMRAITEERWAGVYNGVAPEPVRNAGLARALPAALGRPAVSFPTPAFALRLAMGEMADVILNSNRCVPERLLEAGYVFQHPKLDGALRDVVSRGV